MKLSRFSILLLCAAAVSSCGQHEQQPAAGAAATADAQGTHEGHAATAAGAAVYNKTCFVCHGLGSGGAPRLDDKDAWQARIAQGPQTLYRHAIEGFTGAQGLMPARGANPGLSDAEVKAAVDHMLSQVQ